MSSEREQTIVEQEQNLADLRAEKNTLQGWCDASVKVDEIILKDQKGSKTVLGSLKREMTLRETVLC